MKALSATEQALLNRLLEKDNFIEQIINNSPDLVYVLELGTGKITYTNKRVYEVLGPENMYLDKIHPQDYDSRQRHISYCTQLREGETKDIDVRLLIKGGEWNWFGIREMAFKFNCLGKVTHTIGVARNINDDKLWESALSKKDQLLKKVLSTRSMGIVAYKAVRSLQGEILDYEFVLTSKMFEEFHGRGALIGKWVFEEFPMAKQLEYDKWKHIIETDEPRTEELTHPNPVTGKLHWFSLKYEKFDDGVIIFYEDITSQREMKSKMDQQTTLIQNISDLVSGA